MLACEVLVSDVQALNDALIGNEALLADFLAYFERPAPLDPIRTSYLCRVFSLLLQNKTGEVRACPLPACSPAALKLNRARRGRVAHRARRRSASCSASRG